MKKFFLKCSLNNKLSDIIIKMCDYTSHGGNDYEKEHWKTHHFLCPDTGACNGKPITEFCVGSIRTKHLPNSAEIYIYSLRCRCS